MNELTAIKIFQSQSVVLLSAIMYRTSEFYCMSFCLWCGFVLTILGCNVRQRFTSIGASIFVADPHHVDVDPDPTFHLTLI